LQIATAGTLTVDGSITANGVDGIGVGAGGGAGGGILLQAKLVAGSGAISAHGGVGSPPNAGGGGGGRIALYCATNRFAGGIIASGGAGWWPGGAGTVYIAPSNAPTQVQLVIDNGGLAGATTPLAALTNAVNLTVAHGAETAFLYGSNTLQSLTIGSNSFLLPGNFPPDSLLVNGNASIEATGGILLDGLSAAPVGGATMVSNGVSTGSGGGNGGYGGVSFGGAAGGPPMGALQIPFTPGGAGGAGLGKGGFGGGALNLRVIGKFILNGTISANGADGPGFGSGGGAGGGIYLLVDQLSGSGLISANGGDGEALLGGGGGGGRIEVLAELTTFAGTLTAYGGIGYGNGGAGTIYVSPGKATSAIIVDNGGNFGANTLLPQLSASDLTVANGASVGFTTGDVAVHNLVVGANGVLTAATQGGQNFILSASGACSILSNGYVLLDGRGYGANSGSTPGRYGVAGNNSGGGGGGNGGDGGASAWGASGGGSAGFITQANQAGSGGGASTSLGGAGGGAVQFNVTGNMLVDGTISANGTSGLGVSGGGSGGSIAITAAGLGGKGLLSVNGGAGAPPYSGGGGGGRIYATYQSNTFSGFATAFGGAGFNYGGAGTVCFQSKLNSTNNVVIIRNGGVMGTNTPLVSLPDNCNVTIADGAIATWQYTAPMRSLVITSNALALISSSQSYQSLTAQAGVTIQPGGGLMGDGLGFGPGIGTGAGRSASWSGINTGSGGGHAGYGGASVAVGGGNSYDTVLVPTQPGSGGGAGVGGAGGAGGPALQLNVTGMLNVGGFISANGKPGTNEASGGGAGGAIYLNVGTLAGNGLIAANGGSGQLPYGGGGGGGRVAVQAVSNSFTGMFSAHGGAGFIAGGAGEISILTNRSQLPRFIIDNGGLPGTNTPLPALSMLSLNVTGGASVAPQDSISVGSLMIGSNSFIRPGKTGNLKMAATSMTVAAGGGIDFSAASALGANSGGKDAPGAGGSYGGYGGASGSGQQSGATYGVVSIAQDFGTAGTSGGLGGGQVAIGVTGPVVMDGFISVNGADATNQQGGGGSGGGIYLTTTALSGRGLISANGGAGQPPSGGGGGGGRIAVTASSSQFTGQIQTRGGRGFVGGGAGTVYFAFTQNPAAKVTVDNGGMVGTNTPLNLPAGVDFRLTGAAIGRTVSSVSPLTLYRLVVESNAMMIGPGGKQGINLTVATDALIASNAAITADAAGFEGAEGPGLGFWTNGSGGGGGYGGAGGAGESGAAGGFAYGSSNAPVDFGSGGGLPAPSGLLSQGGGAIYLQAGGAVTVNGTVTANGAPGLFEGAGGGAGGSVWLEGFALAGNGTISANGGAGEPGGGGGGGGGRIAAYFATNGFAGALTAVGAAGNVRGQDGTVVFSVAPPPTPVTPAAINLAGANVSTNGGMSLRWVGQGEVTYQAQWSSNLVNWFNYGAPVIGSNGPMAIAAQAGGPSTFYRIITRN
jgi:hypothetical protein